MSILSTSSWWPEAEGAARGWWSNLALPALLVRGGKLQHCRRSSFMLSESQPRSAPAVPSSGPFAGDEEISQGRLGGLLLLGGGAAAGGGRAGLIKCFSRERYLPGEGSCHQCLSNQGGIFLRSVFFFFLIIIFSENKELSWNLKARGCTEDGGGRVTACQGKGPKHCGSPSTPRGSSPQLLPLIRLFPAWHFLGGRVDTAEWPESSSCCTVQAVSEIEVVRKKGNYFAFLNRHIMFLAERRSSLMS